MFIMAKLTGVELLGIHTAYPIIIHTNTFQAICINFILYMCILLYLLFVTVFFLYMQINKQN